MFLAFGKLAKPVMPVTQTRPTGPTCTTAKTIFDQNLKTAFVCRPLRFRLVEGVTMEVWIRIELNRRKMAGNSRNFLS